MENKLVATNKKFQTIENGTNIKKGNRQDVIKQHVVGGFIPSFVGYLDRYFYGTAEMHLHIGWLDRRPIGIMNTSRKFIRDYCIVLRNFCSCSQEFLAFNRLGKTTNNRINSKILPSTTNSEKLTVLVCVFETTEDTEGIVRGESEIHRLIRLQRYDECPSLRMQTIEGMPNVFPQAVILDHELSVFTLSENILIQDWKTRMLSALSGNTSKDNIIECTSQVMYEITEHNGNHRVRLLSDMETKPDFIMAVRQPEADKLVRIAVCVPSGFLLDVYHVLLSTLKLEPPIIHDMLYYPSAIAQLLF